MKKLTLVRHGVTSHTLAGRFCGHQDPPLHNDGIKAASRLTTHPALNNVNIVVSSPLRRAVETATPIAHYCVAGLYLDDRLIEIDFGRWDGCAIKDVQTSPEYDAWVQDPAAYAPPSGETGLAAQARAIAALEHYHAQNDHVVIVAHKGTIRLILCHYLGLPAKAFRSVGPVPTSSVSQLIVDNGNAYMTMLGDISHMQSGLLTGMY